MNKHKQKINQKSKIFTFILISLVLSLTILISGCSGGTGNQPVNVFTGTEGVKFDFVKDSPPTYQQSSIYLFGIVQNKGAYTLNGSNKRSDTKDDYAIININYEKIYLTRNPDQNGVLNNEKLQNKVFLSGKSIVHPIGQSEILSLLSLNINEIPGLIETPKTYIDLVVCYPYFTQLSESICVDVDMLGLEDKPICKNKKEYSYSGQGAPVAITRIEQTMVPGGTQEITGASPITTTSPNVDNQGQLIGLNEVQKNPKEYVLRPYFKIYFKNVGQGLVFTSKQGETTEQICSLSDMKRGDLNKIKMNAYLDGQRLNCGNNNGTITLGMSGADEGFIICKIPDGGSVQTLTKNYNANLYIEAEYFYRSTTTKEVKINRVS